jgi:hypothetical protein
LPQRGDRTGKSNGRAQTAAKIATGTQRQHRQRRAGLDVALWPYIGLDDFTERTVPTRNRQQVNPVPVGLQRQLSRVTRRFCTHHVWLKTVLTQQLVQNRQPPFGGSTARRRVDQDP